MRTANNVQLHIIMWNRVIKSTELTSAANDRRRISGGGSGAESLSGPNKTRNDRHRFSAKSQTTLSSSRRDVFAHPTRRPL